MCEDVHLGGGADEQVALFLVGDEGHPADGLGRALLLLQGRLAALHQGLDQVVLGLCQQLRRLPGRLWQWHRPVPQEVEYGAKVLAAPVDQDPAWATIGLDSSDSSPLCRGGQGNFGL